MFINFSDIPGHHNLFLDYLYEFDNVKDYYPKNFRDTNCYLNHFKLITEKRNKFNEVLPSLILKQYEKFNPSEKTRDNIEIINSANTLTVFTGQQLGILGGPLYTIYKIFTTLKLSIHLSSTYKEFNFIPVFWLEGDDHDYNEVRSVSIINDANELKKISYNDELLEEDNRGSVGQIKFKDTINKFWEDISANLRPTEFTPGILDRLKTFYSTGKSFKESFKELLFWLFDEYGLIIFDPQDIEIKKLLRPVFKKEIMNFRQHTEKLVNISASLEESYHAQVKIRAVNLFYNYDEGRYLIEPVENEFRLRRKRKKFTQDEILEAIDREPEKFSPNVLLRPICQDYLFPTAFYVGGPSEISYFAQIMPLYDFYNIESPIIYPRSSLTLLEKNIRTIMEKFALNMTDVFHGSEQLKNQIIGNSSEDGVNGLFREAESTLERSLENLKEQLSAIDKTLGETGTRTKEKMFNYLTELKRKASEAHIRKYDTTLKQIDKIFISLYPSSALHERELNFLYFVNKYGLGLLERLFNELVINKFEHQIISL